MDKEEIVLVRKQLKKTQKEMAELLGTSLKAVHSYEQGWRRIPPHAQRQALFLLSMKLGRDEATEPCWIQKSCPPEWKERCPAWEFRAGKLCWFINGTVCEGSPRKDWNQKIALCRTCEVFTRLFGDT